MANLFMNTLKRVCARAIRRAVPPDARLGEGVVAVQLMAFNAWLEGEIGSHEDTLISIVTATRGRPELLRRAGASVVAQKHPSWEWIVVNDGERGSCDFVQTLAPHTGSVTLIEANGVGLAAARNRGLAVVAGACIVYLDDDNRLHPGWLASLAHWSGEHPSAKWGYGARVVETAEVVHFIGTEGLPYIEFPAFSADRLSRGNYIDANVIFHRRGHWRFDEMTANQSDWELLLQLQKSGSPLRIPAIACLYSTRHAERMSRSVNATSDVAHIRRKHGLTG